MKVAGRPSIESRSFRRRLLELFRKLVQLFGLCDPSLEEMIPARVGAVSNTKNAADHDLATTISENSGRVVAVRAAKGGTITLRTAVVAGNTRFFVHKWIACLVAILSESCSTASAAKGSEKQN